MLCADNQDTFLSHQKRLEQLLHGLATLQLNMDAEKQQAIIGGIRDKIDLFSEQQMIVLKPLRAWSNLAIKSGLLGGEMLLFTASAVLIFAFPMIGYPLFILTLVGTGYTLADFVLHLGEIYTDTQETLFKKQTKLVDILKVHALPFIDENILNAQCKQALDEAQIWVSEKKKMDRIAYAACTISLILALYGLTALFLPVTAPLAAVITGTAINIILIAIGMALLHDYAQTPANRLNALAQTSVTEASLDTRYIETLRAALEIQVQPSIESNPKTSMATDKSSNHHMDNHLFDNHDKINDHDKTASRSNDDNEAPDEESPLLQPE
jgi:hypothetical protein